MSAGPRFDDGSDDNLLIAVLKSVWWAMKTAARKIVFICRVNFVLIRVLFFYTELNRFHDSF